VVEFPVDNYRLSVANQWVIPIAEVPKIQDWVHGSW